MNTFTDLALDPRLLKAIGRQGYTEPTPIQAQAIPHVMEGRDLMGLAQTGTGKTAAFGLPLLHHLLATPGKPEAKTAKALVLAPTRELARQIADNLGPLTGGTPLRVTCVVGGASIGGQAKALARGTDVLVATPGRLLDLVKRQAVRLDQARFLVLDEADQMLDLGFIHALREIARLLGSPRQSLLFSATMPGQMAEIAKAYLTDPVRVEVSPPGLAADKIAQSVHFIDGKQKGDLLATLLADKADALSLVFTRTKHGAEKLAKKLTASGFSVGAIHGNKSQNQRERVLKAFRNGSVRVLVATDVAARGLDIPGVTHVYNYELPQVPESYVHRIGRTARAGADGEAVALCTPEEVGQLAAIEKLMQLEVDTASGTRPARGGTGNGKGRKPDAQRRSRPPRARRKRFKTAA